MGTYSRRRFLTTVAGTAAVGLAGCNGLLGGGGGGGSDFRSDAEFVPAAAAENNDDFELVYIDIETFRSEFPEDVQSEFGLQEFETETGIAVDDLGGLLQIQTGIMSDHQVVTGSFEASDVLEEAGIEEEQTSQYEGYDVVAGQLAVTDGALVISQSYETLIDAKAGDEPRLGESEDWSDAIDDAASGTICGVEAAPDEEWSRTSIAMNASGDGDLEFTGYAYFDSASAAESAMDAVENSITEGSDDLQQITVESVSVEGSTVVVEAVAANYQF